VKRVNIAEAKATLSELIEAVLAGDEVIIARRNVPVARLVAVESAKVRPRCGVLKGVAEIADDFDAPLDVFAEYEG
jgi:prevent-host-death family protein